MGSIKLLMCVQVSFLYCVKVSFYVYARSGSEEWRRRGGPGTLHARWCVIYPSIYLYRRPIHVYMHHFIGTILFRTGRQPANYNSLPVMRFLLLSPSVTSAFFSWILPYIELEAVHLVAVEWDGFAKSNSDWQEVFNCYTILVCQDTCMHTCMYAEPETYMHTCVHT